VYVFSLCIVISLAKSTFFVRILLAAFSAGANGRNARDLPLSNCLLWLIGAALERKATMYRREQAELGEADVVEGFFFEAAQI